MANSELTEKEIELMTTGMIPFSTSGMACTVCGLPVALVWEHELLPELLKTWPKNKPLPGMIWGQDVSVVCMCCSYSHCSHRKANGVYPEPGKPTIEGKEAAIAQSVQWFKETKAEFERLLAEIQAEGVNECAVDV